MDVSVVEISDGEDDFSSSTLKISEKDSDGFEKIEIIPSQPVYPPIFQGLLFFLVNGHDMHSKPAEVVKKVIENHKGSVTPRFSSRVTHVISGTCNVDHIDKYDQRIRTSPKCIILEPGWVTECVKKKCIVDHVQYIRMLTSTKPNVWMSDDTPSPIHLVPTFPVPESFVVGSQSSQNSQEPPAKLQKRSPTITSVQFQKKSPNSSVIDLDTPLSSPVPSPIEISPDTPKSQQKFEIISETKSMKWLKECMRIVKDQRFNHNEELCVLFDELSEIYKILGDDQFRARMFHTVSVTLSTLPFKITSVDQVKDKDGIGAKTIDMIQQYLYHGRIIRLEKLNQMDSIHIMRNFMRLHGVGTKVASEWVKMGLKSFDDLKKITLSRPQEISLRYIDDIAERIPRSEITQIGKIVRDLLDIVDPSILMEICGSYRRGKDFSGDIDILLCDPQKRKGFLKMIVEELHQNGLLTDDISTPRDDTETYFGICKIDKYHRRIDLKSFSDIEYPYALLYFTGSAYFNRYFKVYVKNNGCVLSERSLIANDGTRYYHRKESEIFDEFGLEYLEPHERNF